jgi:hypothetical protein
MSEPLVAGKQKKRGIIDEDKSLDFQSLSHTSLDLIPLRKEQVKAWHM